MFFVTSLIASQLLGEQAELLAAVEGLRIGEGGARLRHLPPRRAKVQPKLSSFPPQFSWNELANCRAELGGYHFVPVLHCSLRWQLCGFWSGKVNLREVRMEHCTLPN